MLAINISSFRFDMAIEYYCRTVNGGIISFSTTDWLFVACFHPLHVAVVEGNEFLPELTMAKRCVSPSVLGKNRY